MSMIYDPHVNCPFDESHRILRSRLAFHLTRCAKNHPDAKKKKCPYDVRHLIDPVDFQHHIETCPGRESVMHFTLHDRNDQERTMNIVPIPTPDTIDADIKSSENWDEDQDVVSYNPLKSILQKAVVRTMIGGSKTEKKRFREEERRRIQQLENELEKKEKQKREKENASAKKTVPAKPRVVVGQSEKETVLRRPKKQFVVLDRSNIEEATETVEVLKPAKDDKKSVEIKTSGKPQASQLAGFVLNASQGAIPKKTTNHTKESTKDTSINKPNEEIKSVIAPKTVPFSYAAALNRNTASEEKETTLNCSFMSCHTTDTSMIDQLSQTMDSLFTTDKEDLEISQLDEKINEMKNEEK